MDFTCPSGSDYVPMCSIRFPVCVLDDLICDRIADCAKAADELPPHCENSKHRNVITD